MVDLGLTECYSGFGVRTVWWCKGFEGSYDLSTDKYTRGKLTYSSLTPNDAANVVDELTLLLTGGRLNSASRNLIISAYNNAGDTATGLKAAQKLILATPEFHSTNIVDATAEDRPKMETPEASDDRYKAVSQFVLSIRDPSLKNSDGFYFNFHRLCL